MTVDYYANPSPAHICHGNAPDTMSKVEVMHRFRDLFGRWPDYIAGAIDIGWSVGRLTVEEKQKWVEEINHANEPTE